MKLRTFGISRLLPCIFVSDTWCGTRIILILARTVQLPEFFYVNIHYGHVDPRLGCMESEPTSERGATYLQTFAGTLPAAQTRKFSRKLF